jgi:hypothetical protein
VEISMLLTDMAIKLNMSKSSIISKCNTCEKYYKAGLIDFNLKSHLKKSEILSEWTINRPFGLKITGYKRKVTRLFIKEPELFIERLKLFILLKKDLRCKSLKKISKKEINPTLTSWTRTAIECYERMRSYKSCKECSLYHICNQKSVNYKLRRLIVRIWKDIGEPGNIVSHGGRWNNG